MTTITQRLLLVSVFLCFIGFGCNKNEPNLTGIVSGKITDGSTSTALEGVRIALFDATTNETVGNVLTTGNDGSFSFTVPGGAYYLKLSAQGYKDVPIRGSGALPFLVTNESTLEYSIQMNRSEDSDTGWISGNLSSFEVSKLGVLVVASNGETGYSGVADFEGNYVIYNVPADDQPYLVRAYAAGVNSSDAGAVVASNLETNQVNLEVRSTEGATVSGSIKLPVSSSAEVDVVLTHPDTGEPVPGLSTITNGGSYIFDNVPNNVFEVGASLLNDGLVMDPQQFVQDGDPIINVTGNSITYDIDITNSLSLISPTNNASERIPVSASNIPTFSWTPFADVSDYVIEVSDAYGKVIWGGFGTNWSSKNIVIPAAQTSIMFNSDGNAISSLESGKVYRWRIFASKDNIESPTGWELLSMSEDYMGLILID